MKFKDLIILSRQDDKGRTFSISMKDMILYAGRRSFSISEFALFAVNKDEIFRYSSETESNGYIKNPNLRIAGIIGADGVFAFKPSADGRKIIPSFAVLMIKYSQGETTHSADLIVFSKRRMNCCKQRIYAPHDASTTCIIMEYIDGITAKNQELQKQLSATASTIEGSIELEPITMVIEGEGEEIIGYV